MNATEAMYHLNRFEAAMNTAHEALERAASAMDGEVRNATRWALIDAELLRKKAPRLRAWVQAGGKVERVA